MKPAPLFNGGALEGAAQQAAEASAKEADANYRQTVLAAFVQVADLLSALSTDGDLLEAQTRRGMWRRKMRGWPRSAIRMAQDR